MQVLSQHNEGSEYKPLIWSCQIIFFGYFKYHLSLVSDRRQCNSPVFIVSPFSLTLSLRTNHFTCKEGYRIGQEAMDFKTEISCKWSKKKTILAVIQKDDSHSPQHTLKTGKKQFDF